MHYKLITSESSSVIMSLCTFYIHYAKYCDMLNIAALIFVTFLQVYEIQILKMLSHMAFGV